MCLLRWIGLTLPPEITVTRTSARGPCTVDLPKMPGPSKRCRLLASVFATYSSPLAGLVAMLNSVVPTCANAAVCVNVLALTANTSLSGRRNRNVWSHTRPAGSSQWPVALLNFTIIGTCGACSPLESVAGGRLPPGEVVPSALVHGVFGSNESQMNSSLTSEVWLPVWKPATYTVFLSGLTARARGVSVKKLMMRTGVPPIVLPSDAGLNTQTSARGTDGVGSCGAPAP